jgi:hypothetical protein
MHKRLIRFEGQRAGQEEQRRQALRRDRVTRLGARSVAAHGLGAELARVHHVRGNLCFPLGRLQECLQEHELALDFAQKANAPELQARSLGGLGDAEYARGRMASAYTAFSRSVAASRWPT